MSTIDLPTIDELRGRIEGSVTVPTDPGYDDARTVFYGGIDRRPTLVIRARTDADVARAISFAREAGLELAVRSGGHSLSGHGTTEGGVLLDLADLDAFEIDVEGRTAWAGAGMTAGAYTAAAAEHGLATGFGDTATVGIGGITLGGGIGFLVRKHGLTIDDLLAADVVTADGEVRRVDADTHPDLFWAIRGGGGNFGVVTRFRFRLHPLAQVVGGMLILPATPDTVAGFIAAAEAAPDELTTIANVMKAPPMPFLPPEVHGQVVVLGLLAWAGDIEEGEAAIAPFRALAEPLADMVRPIAYPEMYLPDEEGYHPIAAHHSMFADRVDREVAASILDHLSTSTAAMAVAQLRVLGGAMSRVPNDATAFAHRSSKLMVNLAALCETVDEVATHEAWLEGFAEAVRQDDGGVYVNFLGADGEDRIHDAYPGDTWDRLRAIKARYDPTNLFRLNQNIPPAD